jgi:hypothetical protein
MLNKNKHLKINVFPSEEIKDTMKISHYSKYTEAY